MIHHLCASNYQFFNNIEFCNQNSIKNIIFDSTKSPVHQAYRALCRFQLYHTKNYQRTITYPYGSTPEHQLYHTKYKNSPYNRRSCLHTATTICLTLHVCEHYFNPRAWYSTTTCVYIIALLQLKGSSSLLIF